MSIGWKEMKLSGFEVEDNKLCESDPSNNKNTCTFSKDLTGEETMTIDASDTKAPFKVVLKSDKKQESFTVKKPGVVERDVSDHNGKTKIGIVTSPKKDKRVIINKISIGKSGGKEEGIMQKIKGFDIETIKDFDPKSMDLTIPNFSKKQAKNIFIIVAIILFAGFMVLGGGGDSNNVNNTTNNNQEVDNGSNTNVDGINPGVMVDINYVPSSDKIEIVGLGSSMYPNSTVETVFVSENPDKCLGSDYNGSSCGVLESGSTLSLSDLEDSTLTISAVIDGEEHEIRTISR